MAKLTTDFYFKARIDDLLIYPLNTLMIMRTVSGFTSETLRTEPKYENCWKSANEFGRVSSLCKQVRVALAGILPKQNNLAVVNSFTKRMREILEYDRTSARGERQLSKALATESGRQQLKGYEFNPDTCIAFVYSRTGNSITINTDNIKFPKGIHRIGFRMHQLTFDFATTENVLVSGDWVYESNVVALELPTLPESNGIRFTILEAQFYDYINGVYVSIPEDRGKRVTLVEVG